MNWFKSRCTHDNFWNLVFWLGMTIGFFITFLFGEQHPNAAFISSWSTLIGVPFIVVKGSKVTFTKEEGFFDSKGVSLIGRYPIGFGWMLPASLGVLAIIGSFIDSHAEKISDEISTLLIFGTFFFVNTIYFIHKNCPIAIIFNRHIWLSKIPGVPDRGHYVAPSSSSGVNGYTSLSPNSWYTDPCHRHLSGPIHHRK